MIEAIIEPLQASNRAITHIAVLNKAYTKADPGFQIKTKRRFSLFFVLLAHWPNADIKTELFTILEKGLPSCKHPVQSRLHDKFTLVCILIYGPFQQVT